MQLGIWHRSTKPFDGESVRSTPSGGTETAIAYTSEAAARAGARVTVFCNTPEARTIEGVDYVPSDGLRAKLASTTFDAFVVVRHLAVFTLPIKTRALAYWTHDNLDQPFLHGMFRLLEQAGDESVGLPCLSLAELGEHVDVTFCVSDWQADAIARGIGTPRERLEVIGNGLQPELFDEEPVSGEKLPHVLYSLPPNRGMLPLLAVFARAAPRLGPEAELHLYSRSTIYGATEQQDEVANGELYALAREVPGVRLLEPVDQRSLAQAMRRAMVYAYPTETAETFCISLLEAQAAGAVPVSSSHGAIPERIEHGVDGYLVEGDPYDVDYHERFADAIVRLFRDPAERMRLARAGRERATSARYTYDAVAARMLRRLEREARGREPRTVAFDLARIRTPYLTTGAHSGGMIHRHVGENDLTALAARYRELLRL